MSVEYLPYETQSVTGALCLAPGGRGPQESKHVAGSLRHSLLDVGSDRRPQHEALHPQWGHCPDDLHIRVNFFFFLHLSYWSYFIPILATSRLNRTASHRAVLQMLHCETRSTDTSRRKRDYIMFPASTHFKNFSEHSSLQVETVPC